MGRVNTERSESPTSGAYRLAATLLFSLAFAAAGGSRNSTTKKVFYIFQNQEIVYGFQFLLSSSVFFYFEEIRYVVRLVLITFP